MALAELDTEVSALNECWPPCKVACILVTYPFNVAGQMKNCNVMLYCSTWGSTCTSRLVDAGPSH